MFALNQMHWVTFAIIIRIVLTLTLALAFFVLPSTIGVILISVILAAMTISVQTTCFATILVNALAKLV